MHHIINDMPLYNLDLNASVAIPTMIIVNTDRSATANVTGRAEVTLMKFVVVTGGKMFLT